jgi:NAD(P)-binding Rossmann-like domain
VGARISGLSAAWFFRRAHPEASIMLLDNHDDFGGHARRNEFVVGDRLLIGYGGSESLQSPRTLYGPSAVELLTALGVDLDRLQAGFDDTLYPSLGLSRGVFFSREAFGIDRLVTGDPMRMVDDDIPPDRMNERPIGAFLAEAPVSDASRAQLLELFTSDRDPFPGESDRAVRYLLERRFDYSALDVPTCPVRLRLRSTAVSVRNANGGVVVGYARNGTLHCVHAKACVLAGYAMTVPAIMPELAESQAAALASNVKAPIAYLNVAVRDWHPWVRLGVHEITNPMGFFSRLKLDIRSRSAPTDAHAARTNRSCSISCTCRRSGARTFPSGSGSAAVAICFTTSSSPTSRSAFATSSRGCCLEADSMPTATSPRSP